MQYAKSLLKGKRGGQASRQASRSDFEKFKYAKNFEIANRPIGQGQT